jgi:hypothetical protein
MMTTTTSPVPRHINAAALDCPAPLDPVLSG